MSKNSGGEVTYELVADDSQLESDLNEAGKKVEKSAKKTAKKSEDAEKESAEVKKSVKEDVTKKNEQENEKQEKDDDDSYQNREESAKLHGSKLSSIASGMAKAIGAGIRRHSDLMIMCWKVGENLRRRCLPITASVYLMQCIVYRDAEM